MKTKKILDKEVELMGKDSGNEGFLKIFSAGVDKVFVKNLLDFTV
jgi:hypothetical protein